MPVRRCAIGCAAPRGGVLRPGHLGREAHRSRGGRFTALAAPPGFGPCALIGVYGLAESTLAVTACGRATDLGSCASRSIAVEPGSPVGAWAAGNLPPSHGSGGQRRGAAGLARA